MAVVDQSKQITPLGTWTVDPVHSSVGFAVQHMAVSTFRGEFPDFEASLSIGEEGAVLTGRGRVPSIRTQDANLDAHLQSPDFFDAERHPDVTFRSEPFRWSDGRQVEIVGELTVRGAVRPIELRGAVSGPVEDPQGNERLGLELTADVDRTAFGLDWNMELPKGGLAVANDVTLTAHLELVRGA